jgi:hypothetical protein
MSANVASNMSERAAGAPLVVFLLKSSALGGITFKYPALYQSTQAESQFW